MRLKKSHAWVQALPNDEYVRWQAYVTWETAQHKLAADTARARSR